MTMDRSPDQTLIEALSCEIGVRPVAAPHLGDVTPALRGVRREPGTLLVDFDASIADTLTAVVEAERLCCAELGWFVERPSSAAEGDLKFVRLRVEGTQEQLDALLAAFAPSPAP